jgi:hypothetical protein
MCVYFVAEMSAYSAHYPAAAPRPLDVNIRDRNDSWLHSQPARSLLRNTAVEVCGLLTKSLAAFSDVAVRYAHYPTDSYVNAEIDDIKDARLDAYRAAAGGGR